MIAWRPLLLATGSLALSVAAPAAAQTATFGADLANIPANNAAGTNCSDPVPAYGVPAGSQSCLATYIGSGLDSLVAPFSGTVGAIRVKVGNTTGPMRVDVVRYLFQQNPGDPAHPTSSGPFLQAYGPTFTPGANATTPVATSLAMQEDPTPAPNDGTTIQVIDALALEVGAPNVPVPVFTDNGALTYLAYPSPTQQSLAAPSYNAIPGRLLTTGFGVLMAADIGVPAVAPPPPPVAPPAQPPAVAPPPAIPAVNLPRTVFGVRGGAVTIPVQCLVVDCSGRLALQSAAGAGVQAASAGSKKKAKTYGTATFTVKAGRTKSVRVKLNRSGRGLLKHHRRATVYARVTFSAGGGKPKTFKATLKR
jgi:hypothetical protein